jgi:hypothetical protein
MVVVSPINHAETSGSRFTKIFLVLVFRVILKYVGC